VEALDLYNLTVSYSQTVRFRGWLIFEVAPKYVTLHAYNPLSEVKAVLVSCGSVYWLKVTPSLDQVKVVALLVESMPLAVQVKFSVRFAITKSGPLTIGVASWNNLK
jgi:hypothetical protein